MFKFSNKSIELQEKIKLFMDKHIYPYIYIYIR